MFAGLPQERVIFEVFFFCPVPQTFFCENLFNKVPPNPLVEKVYLVRLFLKVKKGVAGEV